MELMQFLDAYRSSPRRYILDNVPEARRMMRYVDAIITDDKADPLTQVYERKNEDLFMEIAMAFAVWKFVFQPRCTSLVVGPNRYIVDRARQFATRLVERVPGFNVERARNRLDAPGCTSMIFNVASPDTGRGYTITNLFVLNMEAFTAKQKQLRENIYPVMSASREPRKWIEGVGI